MKGERKALFTSLAGRFSERTSWATKRTDPAGNVQSRTLTSRHKVNYAMQIFSLLSFTVEDYLPLFSLLSVRVCVLVGLLLLSACLFVSFWCNIAHNRSKSLTSGQSDESRRFVSVQHFIHLFSTTGSTVNGDDIGSKLIISEWQAKQHTE